MPYFGLHYGGTYSVNPLGIRRDSEAPSRGWMDRKTTSAAGLASSRGTRLLREAAFGAVALAMALGLAAWVTDFDLADLDQSRIRECRQHDFVRRALRPGLLAPFAGRQLPLASRRPFGAFEFRYGVRAHRKPCWASRCLRSRMLSPRRPPRRSRRQSRCHAPGRSWPIFSHREERSGAGFVG